MVTREQIKMMFRGIYSEAIFVPFEEETYKTRINAEKLAEGICIEAITLAWETYKTPENKLDLLCQLNLMSQILA